MSEPQDERAISRRRVLNSALVVGAGSLAGGLLAACGATGTTTGAGSSASTGAATTTSVAATTAVATSSTVVSAGLTGSAAATPALSPASTSGSSSSVTAAAAPVTSSQAVQKGPVTLQYWSWDQVGLPIEEKNFLPPFEQQHPDIKVQATYVPWVTNGYFDKLQAMGASSDAPDVYWQSVAYAWDFANNGLTLNLQPYVDRSVKMADYYERVLATLRFPTPNGGDLYAFPSRWVASLLYYNKDLFQRAGLTPPDETWTYQKLMDTAAKLTVIDSSDPTKTHFGFNANTSNTFLDSFVMAYGGQVLDDAFTKCMLDQEKSVAAFQLVADMCNKLAISPKPGEQVGGKGPSFQAGTIAMSIDGSYDIDTYRQKVNFDWDVAMVPSGPARRSIYGGPDSLSVSAKTRYPDQAWTFMLAYCGPGRALSSYAAGSVPVYKPTANDPAWLEPGKTPANKKVLLASADYVDGAEFSSHWIDWRDGAMIKALDPALKGTVSALDACRNATAGVNAILSQVKINKQVHPNL